MSLYFTVDMPSDGTGIFATEREDAELTVSDAFLVTLIVQAMC